jgi:uncharacterized protein (TIGR02147 family)
MDDQQALREYLQDALIQSRLRNPNYSLRALAAKAGLSPAALSEILNGKRRVTADRAQKILNKLGAAPEKSQVILQSITRAGGVRSYHQLSIDQFYLVADWYHFAILSLAETEDFSDDPAWISSRLNVSVLLVEKALERLERLGALTRNRKGHLGASGVQLSTPDDIAHRGLKQQHSEALELSRHSLENHNVDKRDFLGVTMTLDPAEIPLAKKLLREFVGRFSHRLELGRKKEVYRLNLQLIPLTTIREGGSK